jgi:bacillithiol biosynthesis deacetylase BshB1
VPKEFKSIKRMQKISEVDILALAAHPDDVELACSGTLIRAVEQGMKVGICDMTRGELGTRGNPDLRLVEAEKARSIIGADFRVNLGMADGLFDASEENKLAIVKVIRQARPRLLFVNAPIDRHPDHGRASELQKNAVFLSGLRKIETDHEGSGQTAHRPDLVLHYIQDNYLNPTFIVDVSDQWETKMRSIFAFSSQFYDPHSKEPESPISSKHFMDYVEGRGIQFGRLIGKQFGEGFISDRPIGVNSLSDIF